MYVAYHKRHSLSLHVTTFAGRTSLLHSEALPELDHWPSSSEGDRYEQNVEGL